LSEQGPPPVPGARSDEERERARLEREARRAGRDDGRDGDDGNGVFDREIPTGKPPRAPRSYGHGRNVVARRIVAVILLVIVGLGVWFLVSLFQPGKGEGSGNVTVTVPTGASVGQIGDILRRRA